jgi:(p)ppGpp synthase/HD superfamily hydrolase
MPIVETVRGVAMGHRVLRTARALGVGPRGQRALALVHDLVRVHREARLDDDHDPHYLHPGRTALILMLDTQETDVAVLAAALLLESERPDLRLPGESVIAATGGEIGPLVERALALRAAVPSPGDPDLVEALVVSEPAVRLLAVAERLDHARHAHMWREGRRDARLLEEATAVWGPVAARSHPRLARRFERWTRGARARLAP